ncbi:MAG: poly-beta-1,6-N-acetyl-D-glucosamine biosynthesis protein PgaD [Candidatus Omnitrophota bacterium]
MSNEEKFKIKEDLIINHPYALNPFRKGVELTLTTIGWIIWAVLCRPLLLAFMWFLSVEIFYEHMIRLGGIFALADFIIIYLGCLFVLYLFIRGWNFYNSRRFRGKDRRKSVKEVSSNDLESYFKFASHVIEKARNWKNISVSFKDDNQVFLKEMESIKEGPYRGYFKSG